MCLFKSTGLPQQAQTLVQMPGSGLWGHGGAGSPATAKASLWGSVNNGEPAFGGKSLYLLLDFAGT